MYLLVYIFKKTIEQTGCALSSLLEENQLYDCWKHAYLELLQIQQTINEQDQSVPHTTELLLKNTPTKLAVNVGLFNLGGAKVNVQNAIQNLIEISMQMGIFYWKIWVFTPRFLRNLAELWLGIV